MVDSHTPSGIFDTSTLDPWLTAPWVLCVTSGDQLGARQVLHPGRTLVGNDDECDLILRTASKLPLRALFSLLDDRLSVTAVAGEVRVAGHLVEPGCTQAFEPGDALSIGGVDMSVEEQSSPQVPQPEQAPANDDDTFPADTQTAARVARGRAVSLALATLAVVAFAGAWWIDADATIPRRMPSGAADPEQVRHALAGAGFGMLRVSTEGGGTHIEGWLATERQLHQLMSLSRTALRGADLKVQTLENLVAAGRDAAAGSLPDARIDADGDAALRVQVPNVDIAALRRFTARLLSDVPGLMRLSIHAAGHAEPALTAVRSTPGGLLVTERWSLPMTTVFDDSRKLASVDLGPLPSVLLADGRRIFEGGAVDSHMRIARIAGDAIGVSVDGTTTISVPLR